MESLHGNTQGEDIFEAVKKSYLESDLDMKCLRGICTDGTPALLGRQQGFVTRFTKFVAEEHSNNNVTSIHSIIRQEALCAKVTDFSVALSQVKQIIIHIRSNAQRHRQFRALLDDCEESLEDVLCYIPFRWLSQGHTACRVLNLRQNFSKFYVTDNIQCPLNNSNFLVAMAFLVDVQAYLNNLNPCLQDRNINVYEIYCKVKNVMDKCRLLHKHIMQKQYFHFSQLSVLIEQQGINQSDVPTTTYAAVYESIF